MPIISVIIENNKIFSILINFRHITIVITNMPIISAIIANNKLITSNITVL